MFWEVRSSISNFHELRINVRENLDFNTVILTPVPLSTTKGGPESIL
jgi:hypothetical protein